MIPGNKRMRPFFYMRQIEKSMISSEGGAFVTETLFVPKYVWYQRDAKVQEVDRKISFIEGIKKEF